jgi:hypothetical protein
MTTPKESGWREELWYRISEWNNAQPEVIDIHADSVEDFVEHLLATAIAATEARGKEAMWEVRLEERGLIRFAIEGVGKKHGGIVEEILKEVIAGLDNISANEAIARSRGVLDKQ